MCHLNWANTPYMVQSTSVGSLPIRYGLLPKEIWNINKNREMIHSWRNSQYYPLMPIFGKYPLNLDDTASINYQSVADPGFLVGGVDLVGGAWTPEAVTFQQFCVKMKESGPLGGSVRRARPRDPPMPMARANSKYSDKITRCHVSVIVCYYLERRSRMCYLKEQKNKNPFFFVWDSYSFCLLLQTTSQHRFLFGVFEIEASCPGKFV